jgi:hypothetical protein
VACCLGGRKREIRAADGGPAMTLDVYADLFDDDLTAAADKLDENVGKMWVNAAQTSIASKTRKRR